MSSSDGCSLDDLEDVTDDCSDTSLSNESEGLCLTDDNIDTSQHEDSKSASTIDSDGANEQVLENGKNWAELPPTAIVKIYSFLSKKDQTKMSLVCSRWAREFGSPILWRTMKFYLPERITSPEIYPEVKFARKYSYMFRHVEIIGQGYDPRPIRVIWTQLKLFLQAMESCSQLKSIKFIDMETIFNRLESKKIHDDLLQTLISFFNSQENLKTVFLQGNRLCKEEGLELLKAVLHSGMISNLQLYGFVVDGTSNAVSQQYMSNLTKVCRKFARVRSVELEYSEMFEDIINCLYETLNSDDDRFDENTDDLSSVQIFDEGEEESFFTGTQREICKYLIDASTTIKRKASIFLFNALP